MACFFGWILTLAISLGRLEEAAGTDCHSGGGFVCANSALSKEGNAEAAAQDSGQKYKWCAGSGTGCFRAHEWVAHMQSRFCRLEVNLFITFEKLGRSLY